ncbi:TPA: EAL domain-containing protein [Citrobacter braakii]
MFLSDARIRHALMQRQFVPYLQPLHDVRTGDCMGAEILARLSCPVSGVLLPATFLPYLTQAGELAALTEILLEKTGEWLEGQSLPDGFWLTFNITADMAGDVWLPDACQRLKYRSGGCIIPVVELTEQFPLTCDGPDWQSQLAQLKDAGVLLALDDFGTGCSGLYLLQQTGAGMLKLPREFVSTLRDSEVSGSITDAVVQLAERLGLRVIAEGVETAEQQTLLAEKGITLMQGFYYSPALSPDDFSDYLSAPGSGKHEV